MKSKLIEFIEADCDLVTQDAVDTLKALQNQHLLITGGTGFMGTWIAELVTFLNNHHKFNTKLTLIARNMQAFMTKAPHLHHNSNIQLVEKDVRALIDLPQDATYIIHAAANPDNRAHSTNPLHVIETIIDGTTNVLEKSTLLGNLQKVLNISSGLVYGSQPESLAALPEHHFGSLDCSQVTSIYPEAKRMGETISAAYRTQHRLQIVTARPFAFIGPYQLLEKPWAVNNFIRDGMLGGPIRILGNGETIRSYMYGSDMAMWILRMLVDGKSGSCYNLGSPDPISLKDLAYKIASQFYPAPQVISRGIVDGDQHIARFIPDVRLAGNMLKLTSKISIDSAIQRTIEWNKLIK